MEYLSRTGLTSTTSGAAKNVAADKKEAIKIAINAGIDMAMEPYEWDFCTLLKELVHEGEVPISRINDATRRHLQ